MNESIIQTIASKHECITGICNACALEEEIERLTAVKTPFVGKQIEKRINPQLALKDAKSIIVLGKRYKPSSISNLSSLGVGIDYHQTLTAILKEIAANLNCKSTIMVDSGALAERAFAIKAGLGFWGKNGMIISPILGSFFNIGILIVDIPLTYNKKAEQKSCPKNCNLCISSCPSKAIKPYSIDPNRCISYLTQKKGKLQDFEMQTIGTQLYGCDICQLCCPFNNLTANKQTTLEDPKTILAMDEPSFKERFGKTAMAWRGLEHLKRNAEIVLKNIELSVKN